MGHRHLVPKFLLFPLSPASIPPILINPTTSNVMNIPAVPKSY
ncbi:hypothetical protein SAMN05216403_11338 [Nitrosospira multiformis ATCC 25196]|uniref:Uncharacterized protein n=1 Tax=Nitrosospira multiformis (strain ATCC 25196 / NCIMB 11849 / C 71) TaxID=323848 RepID=A0A1H5VPP6_NITMU|nr:hypothetical protein SAMN05216403_11338 [Nitrosospira multiformis ATCC 25196]